VSLSGEICPSEQEEEAEEEEEEEEEEDARSRVRGVEGRRGGKNVKRT
jgi:hypothetical protein